MLVKMYLKYSVILIILFLNIVIGLKDSKHAGVVDFGRAIFSGFYKPSLSHAREDFAGCFLIHKNRLLQNDVIFWRLKIIRERGIERAVFAILDTGVSLMTRDYFDFEIVHLSATLNQVPDIQNKYIQIDHIFRMRKIVEAYKQHQTLIKYSKQSHYRKEREQYIRNSTLVIIPFTSRPGTLKFDEKSAFTMFNNEIRLLFLEATLRSILLYFSKIMIFVRTPEDLAIVKNRELPIWKCINLSNIVKDPSLLPKYSITYVHDRLKLAQKVDDPTWGYIDYIYYTEMDQLLHMRSMNQIFNVLDNLNSTATIVPHRLQVRVLP